MQSKDTQYLSAPPIEQAKMDLQHFLDSLGNIKGSSLDRSDFLTIYEQYKRIYSQYKTFSDAQINQHFTAQEIKVIEVLALGASAEDRFNDVLTKITSDAAHTAIAVANFIKTRDGFDLAHSAKSLSYSDEELVQFFGSLLGVKIAKECVGQLAGERLGSIIGYALSGRCTDDLKEFEKLQKTQPDLTLVSFLKHKIAQSDHDLSVYEESIGGKIYLHAFLDEHSGAPAGAVRSHHRADHCFVKHAKYDNAGTLLEKGRIIVGLSTNAADMSSQGKSFFKTLEATQQLCAQREYAGHRNPYYGYEVESFYFIGGRFVANDTLSNQSKNQVGRDFLKQLNAGGQSVSKEDLNALAQMPFFALIANAQNATQCASVLQYNCFIAGADTFDIYQAQQSALHTNAPQGKEHQVLETFLPLVCQKLAQNVDTLIEKNTSFERQGKGQLELLLQDITNVSASLVRNFAPVITPALQQQLLSPLSEKLLALHAQFKVSGDHDNGALLDTLRQNARYLKNTEQVMEDAQDFLTAFPTKVVWDSTKEDFLAEKKNMERDYSSKSLSSTDGSRVMATGSYLLSVAKKAQVSSSVVNFLEQHYVPAVKGTLLEHQNPHQLVASTNLQPTTFYSYTSQAISALRSQGAHNLANWVHNTRHVLQYTEYSEALILRRNQDLLALADYVYPQAKYLATYNNPRSKGPTM